MQQMWTALQPVGPNHIGLWSNQVLQLAGGAEVEGQQPADARLKKLGDCGVFSSEQVRHPPRNPRLSSRFCSRSHQTDAVCVWCCGSCCTRSKPVRPRAVVSHACSMPPRRCGSTCRSSLSPLLSLPSSPSLFSFLHLPPSYDCRRRPAVRNVLQRPTSTTLPSPCVSAVLVAKTLPPPPCFPGLRWLRRRLLFPYLAAAAERARRVLLDRPVREPGVPTLVGLVGGLFLLSNGAFLGLRHCLLARPQGKAGFSCFKNSAFRRTGVRSSFCLPCCTMRCCLCLTSEAVASLPYHRPSSPTVLPPPCRRPSSPTVLPPALPPLFFPHRPSPRPVTALLPPPPYHLPSSPTVLPPALSPPLSPRFMLLPRSPGLRRSPPRSLRRRRVRARPARRGRRPGVYTTVFASAFHAQLLCTTASVHS